MFKKHVSIIVSLSIATLLVACSNSDASTQNTETTKFISNVTEQVSEMTESEELVELGDEICETSDEIFLRKAVEELGIAYAASGYNLAVENNTAYVNHYIDNGIITAMYARNQFIQEHEIDFLVPNLEKFVPETYESVGDYVEEDPETWAGIGELYGYVWESSLDTHTGFRWSGDEAKITIDGVYTIYINK